MNSPGYFLRYARTMRYLKLSQVAWRLRYVLAERLPARARVPAMPSHGGPDARVLSRLKDYVARLASFHAPDVESLAALRRNEFTFLNRTAGPADGIDWHAQDVPRLWLYNLHYFEFVRALACSQCLAGSNGDAARVFSWICDWIERNPPLSSPGWDAFVISSRLMNWAQAFAVFGEAPRAVWDSLALQTAMLLRRLEKDVRANHLLKNAQALVVAGSILGSDCAIGQEALRAGLELLESETAEQILPDGGHYERSLMYHCHSLEDMLTVHAVLNGMPAFLTEAIRRMTAFLSRMVHADGTIPLFGDAGLEDGIAPSALIALACDRCGLEPPPHESGCYAAEPSGFYVLQDTRGRMIVKAGEPGPRYQLGHAHCDALSYEFSIGQQRMIVDSGVCSYEDDAWRAYCRGTSAHNTVRVDGREQLEYWSRFRVGRRYRPALHSWGAHAEGWRFGASHDGFSPFRHERIVYLADAGFWLIADRIHGTAECSVEDYVHFHPEAVVTPRNEHWIAERDSETLTLLPFGFDAAELVRGMEAPLQGWHCPSFGVAEPAHCLVLRAAGGCPLICGYAIFPGSDKTLTREDVRTLLRDRFDITL